MTTIPTIDNVDSPATPVEGDVVCDALITRRDRSWRFRRTVLGIIICILAISVIGMLVAVRSQSQGSARRAREVSSNGDRQTPGPVRDLRITRNGVDLSSSLDKSLDVGLDASLDAGLDAKIEALRDEVQRDPQNGTLLLTLGTQHLRKALQTGDPRSSASAGAAIDKARKLLNDSPDLLLAAANLALSQHRFLDARALAERVHGLTPNRVEAIIPLIDANIETGRYDQASLLLEKAMLLRPSVAALSRRSYFRQLHGDLSGSEADMRQAVQAAANGSLDQAAALGYLGDVQMERGRIPQAMRAYDRALTIEPKMPHAVIGRARIDLLRDDVRAAANRLDALIAATPNPAAIALRAEIARTVGDGASAKANDALLDATVKLSEASGSVIDSEFSVMLADRGDATRAVDIARKAYRERQTMFTADALAWSLHQAGKSTEALSFAQEAIATNPSIGTIRAHAALVFDATGDRVLARREARLGLASEGIGIPLRGRLKTLLTGTNVDAPEPTKAPIR
jgi:tetratricopeptide (TPR) repeat protein